MKGSDEPLPLLGHLGNGEPIVKPTFMGRFFGLKMTNVVIGLKGE